MSAVRNIVGALFLLASIFTDIGTAAILVAAFFFEQTALLEQIVRAVPKLIAFLLMGAGLSWLLGFVGKKIGGK